MSIDVSKYDGIINSLTVNGTFNSAPTPGIEIPSTWGANWKAKLRNAKTGNAVLAFIGDSVTQGYSASDLTTRTTANCYVGLLRTQLQALYGDGGSGYISTSMVRVLAGSYTSANTLVSTVGSWAGGTNDGPGVCSIFTTTTNETLTFSSVRGSTITIYYLTLAGITGNFTVSIDGGAADPINSGIGTTGVTTKTYSVAAGVHTVVFTCGGGARTQIYGVRGTNPTGVVVDNYGYSGSTSGTFVNTTFQYGDPILWSGGVNIPCDLLVSALGVNDSNNQSAAATSVDEYQLRIITMFDKIRNNNFAGLGTTDLMLFLPHIGKWQGSGPNYSQMLERLHGISFQYGAALISVGSVYRNSWNYFRTLDGWSDGLTGTGASGTDAVHPSNTGHALYAGILLPILRRLT